MFTVTSVYSPFNSNYQKLLHFVGSPPGGPEGGLEGTLLLSYTGVLTLNAGNGLIIEDQSLSHCKQIKGEQEPIHTYCVTILLHFYIFIKTSQRGGPLSNMAPFPGLPLAVHIYFKLIEFLWKIEQCQLLFESVLIC